jgi:hypothetical protein
MNESSFEKDESFAEYSADAIVGYTDEEGLHLIFAKLKNLEAGPEGGETYLCQINLPIELLDSLPMLYQSVRAKDGLVHQVFLEKQHGGT